MSQPSRPKSPDDQTAMYIRVKHNKTTYFLQCVPSETILQVKEKLKELIDQPVNDQRLILMPNMEVLVDSKSLADQKVENDVIIALTLRKVNHDRVPAGKHPQAPAMTSDGRFTTKTSELASGEEDKNAREVETSILTLVPHPHPPHFTLPVGTSRFPTGNGKWGTHVSRLISTSRAFLSSSPEANSDVLVVNRPSEVIADDNEFEEVNIVRPNDFYQSRETDGGF